MASGFPQAETQARDSIGDSGSVHMQKHSVIMGEAG